MNNQQKIWHSVIVETEKHSAEAIEFALNELNSLGSEINNLGKKKSEFIEVIGYFTDKLDDESLQNCLNKALRIYNLPGDSIKRIEQREIENQDWLAEWKKYWRPTETAKFIIAPTWEEIENTQKTVVRIEPSMAFGTGTHETTKLCVKAIEENYKPEMSFFDVGTGTGILAVCAAKMTEEKTAKKKILACDTDSDSILIARENAALNNAETIEFYVGSISEENSEYDFVCANLTADVIVPILPLLVKKTKQILVLSGILEQQKNLINAELEKIGVKNQKIETDGEWISVLIKF